MYNYMSKKKQTKRTPIDQRPPNIPSLRSRPPADVARFLAALSLSSRSELRRDSGVPPDVYATFEIEVDLNEAQSVGDDSHEGAADEAVDEYLRCAHSELLDMVPTSTGSSRRGVELPKANAIWLRSLRRFVSMRLSRSCGGERDTEGMEQNVSDADVFDRLTSWKVLTKGRIIAI